MNNFTPLKQRRFVELLYQNTMAKKVSWSINDHNQLFATIAGRILFVFQGKNQHGEDTVLFKVFGENNSMAENFDDDSLTFDGSLPSGFDSWFNICNAIYEIAKRQVSGADDALDAMIDELDDRLPF